MNKAMELLRGLVSEIERQTCEHEETHRGGAIWEICDSCGAKWADDEGGKPEFEWPESVEKAREFLAAHPAVEKSGGDERAAFELFVRKHCGMPEHIAVNWDAKFTNDAWEGWKARAALAQPSPVQADEKPGDSILCYGCFAKGVGPDHFDEAGKCLAAQAEQAEAERPELWAVHAQGPDELYAAFTREDAEKHAAELNALPMPEGIAVGAVVVPSPWPAVQHWQYLAEQEQDHKNEIAGRLRKLERICEGLPQDAIDGGWTVQGIRGYAKRLEDQLKAALARVAELEGKLTDWVHEGFRLNEALAVAKAQHSVPDDDMILQIFADNAEHSEQGDEHGYCIVREQHAQAIARKLLAAAPVCRLSRSALTDAQMRRLYDSSTETENERLGFAAFARLIRRAEAVHQIAAAPGKEGV
ncbi:hypothetical protein [Pseudomonas aeruginosa]|uniref:hypothetical protein n=1 Tax=Pseudomonas aeruginosa TaxID=287 RepID=UPI003D9C611E